MADIENKRKSRRLSKTEQWELAHPDDVPCPRGDAEDYQAHRAAREWRKERGIILHPAVRKRRERDLARYQEAMRNKNQRTLTEVAPVLPEIPGELDTLDEGPGPDFVQIKFRFERGLHELLTSTRDEGLHVDRIIQEAVQEIAAFAVVNGERESLSDAIETFQWFARHAAS